MSPAATCHKNGWRVGTLLRGIESGRALHGVWSNIDVIRITSIGLTGILAQCLIDGDGDSKEWAAERSWILSERAWERIGHSGISIDTPPEIACKALEYRHGEQDEIAAELAADRA